MRILLLAVGLLMHTSCGFQLRGSGGFDLDINSVSVTGVNPYGEFSRALESQISLQGIDVVDSGLADFSIKVLSEYSNRRPVATSRDIIAPEYELLMRIRFKVVYRSGEILIPNTALFVERIYEFDRNSLVGSAEEESLVKQEMRRDIAQQLMRRFGAALRKSGSRQ